MSNAHPSHFTYHWENDKSLIVDYKSDRDMIHLFVSIVKGLGKYYKEDLLVRRLSLKEVKIIFEEEPARRKQQPVSRFSARGAKHAQLENAAFPFSKVGFPVVVARVSLPDLR